MTRSFNLVLTYIHGFSQLINLYRKLMLAQTGQYRVIIGAENGSVWERPQGQISAVQINLPGK